MKQIDFKSIIIGFLLCCCMFLIVGWANTDKKGHTHSTNEIAYNQYGFANYGSLKEKIQEIEKHSHSAKDIKYNAFDYGAYGTLQKKIKELDSH